MHQTALFAAFALSVVLCYGSVQVQMPEASELQQPGDEDLQAQVNELQKNVTAIWNYIYELRSAVSHHLTHLRQHQIDLETSMHRMDHLHESELQSNAMHHHSGEQHSHSGEHHSHTDEHVHGSDHSHGSTGGHSHSGEQHSHSGEHHHGDDHGHHSHSYSHSHSSHDHSKEDSHLHGGHDDHHDHGRDHKDSHETEDLKQTQKIDPVSEPIITATTRQEHHHHHHSFNSDSMNLLNEHSHHHHDHNHDSSSSNSIRNRTVILPKYTEYGQYDLALCRVQPNNALPEEQKQNIFGTITMWQKKTGGPLNFHVRLQGFDVGDHAHHQQTIQSQTDEHHESPLPVSHTHGFHIHASGDLSNGCQSTGPHYNPKGVNHGKPGPDALSRHVGDLGNIACDEHGYTNIVFSDDVASLTGQYSVIGKSIVIHAKEDDLGLGGDDESLKTGNAGTRLACCVIQSVDKIPIRQYKTMKIATQRNN